MKTYKMTCIFTTETDAADLATKTGISEIEETIGKTVAGITLTSVELEEINPVSAGAELTGQ